jgi:hypothetical protein
MSWGRVLLAKQFLCLICNSTNYVEPEGSLPHSRHPALVPVLNQIKPVHNLPYCFEDPLKYNSSNCTCVLHMLFFFQVSPQNPACTCPPCICATCPAHLILLYLNLMTQIILGEEYKS